MEIEITRAILEINPKAEMAVKGDDIDTCEIQWLNKTEEICVIGNEDNTFTFKEKYSNVFCYGKEVNDFHTLHKQKLFTLNFAATQELIRENEKLKTQIGEMKEDIKMLKSMLGL